MANLRAHNPDNYDTSKKVQLWLRKKGSNAAADMISVGSVKNVTIEPKATTLPHFSNYRGERAKDREATTQRELTINFNAEEFNIDNLKLISGFGFDAAESGTKDRSYDKTVKNPGAGEEVDLGVTGIKDVIVRSAELIPSVTYVAAEETDSTDDTQGGDFNNTTDPLTVVDAVTNYPNVTFATDLYIKIGSEILRVTDVDGNDVTFARAQFGTTAAAHVNGTSVFVLSGADYYVNETTGKLYPMEAGDLDDVDITSFHIFWQKAVAVHKFEMFPGDPIECEAKLQLGDEIWGPWEGAILKNNGAIAVGDGSDWRDVPMSLDVTVDADGEFGDLGLED